jgi:hypothetical protein
MSTTGGSVDVFDATEGGNEIPSTRTAIRLMLISLGLFGTVAWNGLLIFMIGRMVGLW